MDYDPKHHKGVPIYAIEDSPEVVGRRPMVLREVTDPEERKAADQVPFYYVVKVEDPDEAPPAA